MDASELFKAGRLADAVAAQTQAVKAHPADANRRLFLFELLAFSGDLDRARKQLDAIQYDEPELIAAVAGYRQILDAEAARRDLFDRGKAPQFLAPPPDHATVRLQALEELRGGDAAKAAEWLAHATGIAPPLAGTVNGRPFEGLRDCDDLFGPVLEVFAQGRYFWVPLELVESLRTHPQGPRFPRDLLWLPARLETAESAGDVFLPALYPGSHGHRDEQVRLGRVTDWARPGGDAGPVLGVGARAFLAGDQEVGLLELRDLQVRAPQNEQWVPA
jgi:type VI secretion system protein ImpE